MDIEELLNDTLEEYLMEVVGDKVEDVAELPNMLKDISYLDNKEELIAKTDYCEILEPGDAEVEDCEEDDGDIHLTYVFDYIMQTFIKDDFIWRIQGTIRAELTITDADSVDWSEFEDGDFDALYDKFKELVRFDKVKYDFIECDTLYN